MFSFALPKRCENNEDSYRTVFHEVNYSLRVKLPQHLKRFEVRMFTFVQGTTLSQEQVRYLSGLLCAVGSPDGWAWHSACSKCCGRSQLARCCLELLVTSLKAEHCKNSKYSYSSVQFIPCGVSTHTRYLLNKTTLHINILVLQLYFHCSVVICSTLQQPSDFLCPRRCNPGKHRLGKKTGTSQITCDFLLSNMARALRTCVRW